MPPPKRQRNEEVDEEHRQRVDAVVSRIGGLDEEGVRQQVDDLSTRWALDWPSMSFEDCVRRSFDNFGVAYSSDIQLQQIGDYGIRSLDNTISVHEMEAIALFQQSRKVGVLASDQALYGRLVKCLESIYYAKKIVMSCFQSKLAVHQLHALENNDLALDPQLDARLNSWTIRFRWIDDAESNSLQKLLLHLLDVATEKGYRKRGDFVMEPIQLPGGHNSHAWREVCSIKDFVYKSCSKEICFDAWQCLTHSSSNARSAVEYLSSCEDFQFRTLKQDRHIFSFSNGVYMAKENRMWLHEDSEHPLLDSVSAAKYFELELNKEWVTDDWRSIPTPFLDSIAIFQQWSPEVIDVLYMLLGRMLYDVNEMDGWQVMPFLRGAAGSGKSTLALNVVRQFYMPADVGLLSNNVEKKFGLSGLVHSLIFLAPEVRSDLAIEQAEWQSIVSGETVQVAVKNKTASSVEWRAPGRSYSNNTQTILKQ